MKKIEKIFAFVAEGDGEGIVSMQLGDTHMPLIGADMKRVDALMPHAQMISNATGKNISIVEFSSSKKIGEINPLG